MKLPGLDIFKKAAPLGTLVVSVANRRLLAFLLLLPFAFGAGVLVLVGSIAAGIYDRAAASGGECGGAVLAVAPKRGASAAAPGGDTVPSRLIPIYHRAAARYSLGPKGPRILAAINEVETGFGSNAVESSAGATGWMQFMPATWDAYGVDADGDGVRDPGDPEDAIFAAARYLRASGAPGDWYGAIFAYNHADWYVKKVEAAADRLAAAVGAGAAAPSEPCNEVLGGPRLQRLIHEANRIDSLAIPYVYGGSHGLKSTPRNGPFDCSSAVSHLLQVAGYGNPTMATPQLIGWGEGGPGRELTIYVKPYGADAHTFLEFRRGTTPARKRYWGTSRTNPDGSPGWIAEGELSASYLAGFEQRHPPGL